MRRSTWRRLAAVAAVLLGAGLAGVAVLLAAHRAGCSGVVVTPSSNIQKLIDSHLAGSRFCFQPGTYTNASQLEPQKNDVFDGDGQQAMLDGGNHYQFAFYGDANSTGPAGVIIQNFTIQNYATPLQRGAIQDYNGPKWVIQGNDIEHNAAAAVATGDYVRVLNNKLDSNAQEGFSAHGTGGLYQGNDISDNNDELGSDPNNGSWAGWEAGAGKAAFTTNLTFKNNVINNNGCNGLWMDTDNYGTVVENNTIDNNCGAGVYEEDSYNFTITGNDIESNGMPSSPGGGGQPGWAFGAAIQLRRSGCIRGVTCLIADNTVYDNYNGIDLIESPATQAPGQYGNYYVQNVTVQDNGISATKGALTGAWQDGEGNLVFSNGNSWQGNNYCVSQAPHPNDGYTYGWFGWLNGWTDSFSAWKGYAGDAKGTFTVTTSKCTPPSGSQGSAQQATTSAATGVTSSAATLNGSVNLEGQSTTSRFQYGTTTSYGNIAPASRGPAGSGTSTVNESASLSGLQPGTTYHYRLTATNASGTTNGSDQTFTTAAPRGGGVTYDATGPGSSGATVVDQAALSWKHTISGTSPALLVGAAVGAAPDSGLTASATYDGQAMTLLKQVHVANGTAGFEDMFGLLNAPTGTHSVSVKVSGGTPNEITGGSESFDNVTQFGAATSAYGKGSTASVTISGSTSGDIVAGHVATGTSVTSASSPATSRFIANVDHRTGAGNSAGATSPSIGSNVTLSWSVASDLWGAIAVEVQGPANAAEATMSRTQRVLGQVGQ
jgi:parallel beta-helix repeat protein